MGAWRSYLTDMDRILFTATALLLGLVLAMTSVSMAVARGGMSLSGSMILCIDGAQQVVAVGLDGQPIEFEDEHPCPDCIMGALALTDLSPLATPEWRVVAIYVLPFLSRIHEAPVQGGQGRGPPVLI